MPPGAKDTFPPPTLSLSPCQASHAWGGPPCPPSQGGEGSSRRRYPLEERAAPLPAARLAALCPPPRFSCTGTMCPGIGWGGCPCRPGVPSPSALCRGGNSTSCPLALPTLPSRSCSPSGWHPKAGSHWMRSCLASLGVPLPLALVGGPPRATLGQSPPSNPLQEPVPAGLEMLYI